MKYRAKVVCDSIGPNGVRLTTMEFDIWKPLLAEFNTHGLLGSRNFPSSRAIPWPRVREKILTEPHVPVFRKNNPGMQAAEPLSDAEQAEAAKDWLEIRDFVLTKVEKLGDKNGLNIHKQWLNRWLEPCTVVTGLVTATEWDNFFNLRLELNDDGYPMAQDEFYFMARAMKRALDESEPRELKPGDIHAPYVSGDDTALEWADLMATHGDTPDDFYRVAMMLSAGKCATVSYDNLGQGVDHGKDYKRSVEMLLPNGHMSVFQHQAICLPVIIDAPCKGCFGEYKVDSCDVFSGQLRGWTQFRKTLPCEACWQSPRQGVELALTLPELSVV